MASHRTRDRSRSESDPLLGRIAMQSPDPIVTVDRELRVTGFNPACETEFERAFGSGVRIGMSLDELFASDPVAADTERAAWTRALEGESVLRVATLGSGENSDRPFELAYRPLLADDGSVDGALCLLRALPGTDPRSKLADALLAQKSEMDLERRRLRALLDVLPVGVWVADANGRIVTANLTAREIWGHDTRFAEEMKDYEQDYPAWWPDGTRLTADSWALSRALRGGESSGPEEIEIETATGERKHILNYAVPIRGGSDEIVGGVAVNVDVTEKKRAEEAALAATREKEELLAIVSHDLRAPLSAIGMASALILEGKVSEERKAALLDVMGRTVGQCFRLIDDLLDAWRLGKGALSLKPCSLPVAELVHEAVGQVSPQAEEKGVRLWASVAPDLPPVRGDRDRLLQVFGNLLSNAVRLTPAGGSVRTSAALDDAMVRFTVSDTGPGVVREEVPFLFDPLHRGALARGTGAGLGLSIARGLVEEHDGRMGVDEGSQEGAVFWFEIPVADEDACT